jgi:hypothetical protein
VASETAARRWRQESGSAVANGSAGATVSPADRPWGAGPASLDDGLDKLLGCKGLSQDWVCVGPSYLGCQDVATLEDDGYAR